MAFVVTAFGGVCLLVGFVLLGHIVGSYDVDRVLDAGDLIRGHALYLPALVLILIGAFTKSAQFPFHFWLPHAMAAPTPVSPIWRSEEHTSELQSLMRISDAVLCLKKKKTTTQHDKLTRQEQAI